jgi:hypothetical protein
VRVTRLCSATRRGLSDRGGLFSGPIRSRGFRRRRASIASERRRASVIKPTRLVDVPPDRVIAFEAFFPSLGREPRGGRGQEPPSIHQARTRPPSGDNAGWQVTTGPAVKTGNPCLSPRGADRAVGGIQAWAKYSGRRANTSTDTTPMAEFLGANPQIYSRVPYTGAPSSPRGPTGGVRTSRARSSGQHVQAMSWRCNRVLVIVTDD